MTETTSQWQLPRRETGWEGSRRRTRGPRNTNRVEGGAIRASQHALAKPASSRDRNVDAAGVRGRLVPFIRGDLPGCRPRRKSPNPGRREAAGHPAGVSRGHSSRDRAPRRAKREAEAKRARARGSHSSQPRPGGGFAQKTLKMKPEAPREERSGFPVPGIAEPHPADAKDLWEEFLSRENLAAALRRVERKRRCPASMAWKPRSFAPGCMTTGPKSGQCSTRAPTTPTHQEGHDPKALQRGAGAGGARRLWIE